jgi:uncharacterized membrane protein YfcA
MARTGGGGNQAEPIASPESKARLPRGALWKAGGARMVRSPGEDRRVDSPYILLATASAFLLAGFVKGVIGMGLPTVAIGLLGLLVTPAQAAAILIVPSLFTNVWQGVVGGALAELLRRLWPMLAGIVIGTVVGAMLLPPGSSSHATVFLGATLAVYAVLGLSNVHFHVPPPAESLIGLPVGILTGIISVGTGVFAIPMVPYINALGLDRDRLVQALGLSFTVATVTLAAALYHAGEMRLSLAWIALLALAAALAGMWIGQRVRGRIRPATFRRWFFIGLLLLGLHLALRNLM